MKKCFFLVTLTSICLNISAATFTIDKLSFDTINGNECVVYATNPFNLHGSIDIPSHVEFGGRSFVVTIIRCDAFRGSKISRVKIPDTIKKIEPMAFCGTRVKSVDIPSSVKIIGHDAFRECHRLKVVQLHEGLLQIEPGAFCGCHSLRQIIIPASVRYIGDYCFCECKRLHNAYLLGQPDSCGVGVFIDCNLKTQVPISQLMDSLYLEPMINQMIDQMINRWDSLIEEGYFQTNSFTPMLEPMMHIWQNSNGCRNEIYYTHGDHLGSANWITDIKGNPIQYIHYAPYGELIANQQTIGYDERFKFTGKERDWETGYDYFGARFYWSADGIFTTVDPLADKYPGNTPYLYCGGNPIMLVDPDGREKHIFLTKSQSYAANNFKDDSGIYIFGHGNGVKNYIQDQSNPEPKNMPAKELADFITKESSQWEQDVANGDVSMIFLYACHAGEGDNSVAQDLSLELSDYEAFIIAPIGILESSSDPRYPKDGKYQGVKNNRGQEGAWGVYKNGKLVTTIRGNKNPTKATVKCKLFLDNLWQSIKNFFSHENE